jgi:S-formylglutathione hydrolase FrmB
VADSADLPVVYYLHGLPGSETNLADETNLVSRLDAAFTSGRLAPFVVAAPDGTVPGVDDPEWADSADGRVRLESFITGPLTLAVEGSHPRTRGQRAIAGFSMGGFGAMNIALRHPDLYGQVVTLAGYFDVDDPSGVFGGDPAVEAANSPDHRVAAARHLRVMLADGVDDDEPVTRGETQRFAGLLDGAGIPATVDLRPGGHDYQFVESEFPRIAKFLEEGWTPGG